MKKNLTHNLGLKILAILFSVCLWLISININDPVTPDSYNVTVQLLNMKSMTNDGKYVEILDDTDEIRVTVRASRSVFSAFSEKNIVATADLTKMTEDNLVPIDLTTTKTDEKIESIKADKEYVKVNVENIKKTQIPITVQVQNLPADGYILGGTATVQNAVIVSGPESVVSQIDFAAVEINVDGATSDVNISLPIHLYDAEGNDIDDTKLTKSVTEVSTTASILQTKEVALEYDVVGTPADGYMVTGEISSTPQTVTIAGKPNLMKSISRITIPDAINVTGFDSNVEVLVDVKEYLPDGTILADSSFGGKATVIAYIDKQDIRELEVSSKKIRIINIPEGFKASIKGMDDPVTFTVKGLKDVVDAIKQEELNGTIDMQAIMDAEEIDTWESGNYTGIVTFDLPENVITDEELEAHIVLEKDE